MNLSDDVARAIGLTQHSKAPELPDEHCAHFFIREEAREADVHDGGTLTIGDEHVVLDEGSGQIILS